MDRSSRRVIADSPMASWAARTLLVTAGCVLVGFALWYARAATVPLIVAALLATQLLGLIGLLTRRGLPRGVAIAVTMLGVVALGVGLTWLFSDAIVGQLDSIAAGVGDGVDEALAWLRDNSDWVRQHEAGIRAFLAGLLPAAKSAAGGILSGLAGTLSLAAQLVSSALLTLVFLLYLLTDGASVWRWVVARFGAERRERVDLAGAAAWSAATGYVRGIALVAFIDSLVIGLGMLVFGTPLAGTLMLLSFFCLFIPILGAWVSGALIVLITLGAQGAGAAAGMAVVILVGQQLDSMFVTPLVYQRQVNLHPIVTLGSVIVGAQLMGIVGAFLTVPIVAVCWAVWRALEEHQAGAPPPAPG